MDETQFDRLTITTAAALIKQGKITPVELVEASLERIARFNPRYNVFLTVMREQALEQAEYAADAIRRGEDWGTLHGIPIGVKDLIDVEGVRTTAGSRFMRSHVANDDADAVRRLKAAGAIIIGKTHLHEFAIGATNINPHYGAAHNPWDWNAIPGGSSGGSAAAVAAGMCLGALGTDTGGSVRMPAALCNLTGLRPGLGRISTQGTVTMSWHLDTVGPMARTAEDVALLFDVLSVEPGAAANRVDEPIRGLRIGVPGNRFFTSETNFQVMGLVQEALERLEDRGAVLVDLKLPPLDEVLRAAGIISLGDAAAFHRERMEAEPENFGADVRARLEAGAANSAADYAWALQVGREWRQHLHNLLPEQADLLAVPTTPITAPEIAGVEPLQAARDLLRFTYPFSLSGLAALSLPVGFSDDGLPVGMQLIGLQEAVLLQMGYTYQQHTDWHLRRPTL